MMRFSHANNAADKQTQNKNEAEATAKCIIIFQTVHQIVFNASERQIFHLFFSFWSWENYFNVEWVRKRESAANKIKTQNFPFREL